MYLYICLMVALLQLLHPAVCVWYLLKYVYMYIMVDIRCLANKILVSTLWEFTCSLFTWSISAASGQCPRMFKEQDDIHVCPAYIAMKGLRTNAIHLALQKRNVHVQVLIHTSPRNLWKGALLYSWVALLSALVAGKAGVQILGRTGDTKPFCHFRLYSDWY